ncbi:MAG: hypothetical protein S4CHLAM102_13020 [Chlamydiia bacterium]|nr:hypothetical protein [Chlamydiia bacterium]
MCAAKKLGLPEEGSEEYDYWLVVVSIAALAHDCGHLAFSHVAEPMVLSEHGHEEWTYKILYSHFFDEFFESAAKKLNRSTETFRRDVSLVALGKDKYLQFVPNAESCVMGEICAQMIASDQVGADRMDYLLRDAYHTGLPFGNFDYHQLIECIQVTLHDGKPCLAIDENGVVAVDSLLVGRIQMYQRLYQYSKCRAFNYHARQVIAYYYKVNQITDSLEKYVATTDAHIHIEIQKAIDDPSHPQHENAKAYRGLSRRKSVMKVDLDTNLTDITQLQKKYNLTKKELYFEEINFKNRDLTCPVITPGGKIIMHDFAKQLTYIPHRSKWVVVDPKHQDLLQVDVEPKKT